MSILKQLLPQETVRVTNSLDKGDWSYDRGPLGWAMRARFSMVVQALDRYVGQANREGTRLVEIGYGSGLFLPILSRYASELIGVDVHPNGPAVHQALARRGIDASLLQCPAERLSLPDNSIDTVVAVSCLEFMEDLDAVARELARVLRPGGYAVTITPGQSWVLDHGFQLLSGERGEDTFQGRRGLGVVALGQTLQPVESRCFPPMMPSWLARMYTCSVFQAV